MNRANKLEYDRRYRREHREQTSAAYRRYYRTEKGQARLNRRRINVIREKILEKYGSLCARCGFNDPRALQVDHVNGGGKKELSQYARNYRVYYKMVLADTTGKFQILCANCNWIKRYENKECRHDRIKT